MKRTLPQNDVAQLGAELNGARRTEVCFEILDRWLPRLVQHDHFDYLFADIDAGSFVRRTSPGLPAEIFADYPTQGAKCDLILKLARSASPGSYLHLAALKNHLQKPPGWDEQVKRLADVYGFIDSITIVLYFDQLRQYGLALTVWRAKPNTAFSTGELGNIANVGPMLSNAFTRTIEQEYEHLNQGVSAKILAGANQFAFLVSKTGTLLAPGSGVRSCLKSVFGNSTGRTGLPREFSRFVAELIGSLEKDPALGISSTDFTNKERRCRVYVSRVKPTLDGSVIYKVLVDCNPETFSLSLLAEAGLTDIQIRIVELLQSGVRNTEIAKALNVCLGNVSYHLEQIGKKLCAEGRTEILARAHMLYHDLAIRHGLAGPPHKRMGSRRPFILVRTPRLKMRTV